MTDKRLAHCPAPSYQEPMVAALLIILSFQLAGEVFSRGLGLSLPGPVLGMIGLLIALVIWPKLSERLRPVTSGLLGHLSLLFVPAGVGIVAHAGALRTYGVGIAAALMISTALALAAGAWAFTLVARWTGDDAGPETGGQDE